MAKAGPALALTEQQELVDEARITFDKLITAMEFGELPGYLGSVDVGLVPYNHSAFNDGSFQLKALGYLGAGLRVVATDLPAVRWLDSPDIAIADGPAPFAQAVRKGLKAPGGSAARKRRQAFARRHTWAARAEEFSRAVWAPLMAPEPAPAPAASAVPPTG